MAEQTVFHKIVAREIPAYIIAEDDNHMAFLDIYPSRKGNTVVIPKRFTPSQFTEADDDLIHSTMNFAKKVAKQIEEKLEDVTRVFVIIEGTGVNYFHVKLYPGYGENDEVTQMGDKADEKELQDLQKKLTA